ncbi:MAG: helix-hairpin-helix domain-containing protein [Saprospiraceae bacterium]|nr:helix-hairpin-helix domain-containing protein [Saprospiraceae bacterium]
MKQRFISYLHFTRKERFGTMLLLCLCVLVFCFTNFKEKFHTETHTDFSTFESTIKEFRQSAAAETAPKTELFEFNPNTATESDFLKLGLPLKIAQNILKYRSKGGQFRKAEDFKKIWGLTAEDAHRLIPYIRLGTQPSTEKLEQNHPESSTEHQNTYQSKLPFERKSHVPGLVDLNTADRHILTRLPMIGDKRADQIIRFREKLGGFQSVEQLREMYNFPDSVFQVIQPLLQIKSGNTQKINVNEADVATLDAHPYISRKQAALIVAYREQHGSYASVEEILKIRAFSDRTWFDKVSGYFRVD